MVRYSWHAAVPSLVVLYLVALAGQASTLQSDSRDNALLLRSDASTCTSSDCVMQSFANKKYALLESGMWYLHEPSANCQGSSIFSARHLVVEEEHMELQDIVNPVDLDASDEVKLDQIAKLTDENMPLIAVIVQQISEELNTFAKYNFKSRESILAKAYRPIILAEKPWHRVEHVRDTLRFKARLTKLSDIPRIVQIVMQHGVTLVKVDSTKLMEPKQWGWRFIGFDFRFPNGQLVEFYAPPLTLDLPAVKGPNHLLFEQWRYVEPEALADGNPAAFLHAHAVAESRERYDAAFDAFLSASGYADRQELKRAWGNIQLWSDLDGARMCPQEPVSDELVYMMRSASQLTHVDDESDEDGNGDARDPRADPILWRLIIETLMAPDETLIAHVAETAPEVIRSALKGALTWLIRHADLREEHVASASRMVDALLLSP